MKKLIVASVLALFGTVHAQQDPAGGAVADSLPVPVVEPRSFGLADLEEVHFANPDSARLRDHELAARYDSLWMLELQDAADRFPQMYQEVLSVGTEFPADSTLPFDTGVFRERLARLNQKTPFNITYSTSLESVVKMFLTRKRDLMERMLTASQFYFPMFEEALDKHELPMEIKYLAIVESALNPKARSRVGATGLWQFMYGTGRMYDLDVSSYVDERNDPIQSTEAACKYLKRLHGIFGDWDLALAAYNSGPGNVNKAIRRSGGYTNYWSIRGFLPRETAGYVPAFFAAMYIFEYAAEHGLTFMPAERPYFETDTLWVKSTITFEQVSRVTGVPESEITMLNPAYKLGVIPKIEGKNYILRLPRRSVGAFVANEEAIYALAREELAKKEKEMPRYVEAEEQIRYRVRSGDYLGKIAERYGVGVSQIKRWNGLRSNDLRVGQRLTIYPRKPVTEVSDQQAGASQVAGNGSSPRVHVVREGDSLWTISRKYPGISIENLREWNGIRGNNLRPGTRLKLCNCSS